MSPKEESEIHIVKKACLVSVDVFNKYLKDQIMETIDADKVFFCIHIFSNLLKQHNKYLFGFVFIFLENKACKTF